MVGSRVTVGSGSGSGWRDGPGVPLRRREEEVRVGFAYPWWLAGVVVVAGLAVG